MKWLLAIKELWRDRATQNLQKPMNFFKKVGLTVMMFIAMTMVTLCTMVIAVLTLLITKMLKWNTGIHTKGVHRKSGKAQESDIIDV